MSRFMMVFQISLAVVFFVGVGVKANPMTRCLSEITNLDLESFEKMPHDEQYDALCNEVRSYFKCVSDVIAEGTGIPLKDMASLMQGTKEGNALKLIVNLIEFIEEMCTDETQLHKDYFANIECFRGLYNGTIEECKEQAKDAFKEFNGIQFDQVRDVQQEIDAHCMVEAYKLGCYGSAIHENCKTDALEVYKEMIRKLGFFKSGVCSGGIMHTIKADFLDSLEISESRKSLYRVILELRKR